MKAAKNLFFGFLVSFLGSLPLGYLNIIGVEIFSKFGMNSLLFYLWGVILVEALVVYVTIVFAKQLMGNKRLMKSIDFFAVPFFVLLAYLFFVNAQTLPQEHHYLEAYIRYSPFLIGLVLCGLNFLQIPFWIGWNLYLMNANYVLLVQKLKYHYIFGTFLGTFFGMLLAIILFNSLSQINFPYSKYLVPVVIPLFFITLALFQVFRIYGKYFRIKKN